MSIRKSTYCMNLTTLSPGIWEYLHNEDFTVMRHFKQSGEETGWHIQQIPHPNCCPGYNKGIGSTDYAEMGNVAMSKYINICQDKNHRWSVFMNNGCKSYSPDFIHEHACGWYVCDPSQRTFWPTRCKSPLEKEAWWAWFDSLVKSLPTWKKPIYMWPITPVLLQGSALGRLSLSRG